MKTMMKMLPLALIRHLVLILPLALACSSPFGVQAAAQDNLASAVQKRYTTIDAFTATFTQTLTHQESASEEVRQGTLSFKKPRLLRFETDAPYAQSIIANDELIWDYLPDEAVAYQYALSMLDESASIYNVITGQSRFDTDFVVQEEAGDGAWRVLVLFPNEPSTQFTEAKIWIHAKTYLMERIIITDFYGNTNDLRFKKIQINPNLPASTFAFTPPPGVDIEDTREDVEINGSFLGG